MLTTCRHSIRRIQAVVNNHLQKRHAQVVDVRFLASHTNSTNITNKYADKLQAKANKEGFEDVGSLKTAYASTRNQPSSHIQVPFAAPANSVQKSKTKSPIKQLSAYIDIEKTARLPAKEVEAIWRLRHANDPLSLCAVIPVATYNQLARRAKDYPSFILPLPRFSSSTEPNRRATEIHFLQHAFPTSSTSTTILTALAEYKLHGEYARPHTTIVYHTDFAESHGLVLMNGSVMDGGVISVEQAQFLLVCLQGFYAGVGEQDAIQRRVLLLKRFSCGDTAFKIEDVIEEADRLV